MPELPEVETVRRALETTIRGRTIARVWLSGLPTFASKTWVSSIVRMQISKLKATCLPGGC